MSQEPCLGEFHHDGNNRIYSGDTGENRYHVLLLLQDLALADPNSQGGISVDFTYRLEFRVDTLEYGQYHVSARFGWFDAPPAVYRGFRLRQALVPQFAELTLSARNRFGLEAGGFSIDSVRISRENGPWVFKTYAPTDENGLCFKVNRVSLMLDESYYERFRADLARVDRYYSAASLTDSLMVMSDETSLDLDADIRDMIARWIEVRRILGALERDTVLQRLLNEYPDPEGLAGRLSTLERRLARQTFKTGALIRHNGGWGITGTASSSVAAYVDRLRRYRETGSRSYPFRQDLFTEMSRPVLTRGQLARLREMIVMAMGDKLPDGFVTRLGRSFQDHLLSLARQYRVKGEYQAAGEILQNAIAASKRWPGLDTLLLAGERTGLARETVSSYLNVSRQALQKDNATLADHYFRKAMESANAFGSDQVIASMIAANRENLAGGFIRKAEALTMEGDYRKSLDILLFVDEYCYRAQGLECPERLVPMIRENHEMIYRELIRQGEYRLAAGMLAEATMSLEDAKSYRSKHSGMVNPGTEEIQLERRIRQQWYHGWINRGDEARRYGDAELALYYFMKAHSLDGGMLLASDTSLNGKISGTARPLIEKKLADGMLKAWGLYLPEARKLLASGREMMERYGMGNDRDLLAKATELEESIRLKECRKREEEYAVIFGSAMKEKELGRFIAAKDLLGKALDLSKAHPGCGFNDLPAYAEKIALEPLAEFENRQNKVFLLLNSDYRAFIAKYQELSRDFQEMGLAAQGAKLVPLHEWALSKGPAGFLTFLARYYLGLLQPDMALQVLKRIRELDPDAGNYAYLLEETGRQLALRDAGKRNNDLVSQYRSYELQNRWFKVLWKKYRKTWTDVRGRKFGDIFLFLKR